MFWPNLIFPPINLWSAPVMPLKEKPDVAYCSNSQCAFKADCARSVEIRNYPQHIRVQVFQPDPRTGECVFFERRK